MFVFYGLYPCLVLAEIEFIYAIKERQFQQSGNSAPSEPEEWSLGAGGSGDSQLTALSITFPGSEIPTVIDGEEGEFDLDTEDEFATQAELNEAFPNGSVTLTVTDAGDEQVLGPFTITGDNYPMIPYFTNGTDLYSHDLSQEFELTWNAFAGADEDDQVLIQIWNNKADEEVLFMFLDASATSYMLPADTFSPNGAYDVDITFINETDGLQSPDTIIGYLSTTTFFFTTYTSDTQLWFYKWQRNFQTGPETIEPGSPAYRPFATVTGNSNSVDYAQVSNQVSVYPLFNPGPDFWILNSPFISKEDLDRDYPAGEYEFGLVENETEIGYGRYFLPGDAYPVAPQVENYSELLNFDATGSQTISWGDPGEAVHIVNVSILQAGSTVWSENLEPSTTSVELPADTLLQDADYLLVIRFWAAATTSENPPVSLGYLTSTAMGFQTGEGAGGEPGIDFVYAVKQREFFQEVDGTLRGPTEWEFGSGAVGGNDVTGGSLSFPGGSLNYEGEPGDFSADQDDFSSQEELDNTFPNGDYTIQVTVDGANQVLGPFDISGDTYPPAPQILNLEDLSSHDFSQPFTLTWNAFPDYDPEDQIIVEYRKENADEDFFEFVPPETTSYEFPGNTFSPESQYEVSVMFINETAGLEEPDTVIGYLTRTNGILSSITSDTELAFYKFKRHEQVGTGAESLEDRGYFTSAVVTANSNTVTYAVLETDTASYQLNNPNANPFFMNTLWDDKAAMDAAYPAGEYRFYLEENGSGISYAPYFLPPDAYPTPGLIQNFEDLVMFDATEEKTVSWSPAPEGVTQILVRITSGFEEEFVMELDPSATSVVIPANTLGQYKNHRLLVGFWTRLTGSEFPDASLGYVSSTFMSVQTVPPVIEYQGWVMLVFNIFQQGNTDVVAEDADPDGDRLSNYLEFLLGTNPNDPNSGLSSRMEGRTLIIGPIPDGAIWEIRSSTDLTNWTVLGAENYTVESGEISINLDVLPAGTFLQLVFSDL